MASENIKDNPFNINFGKEPSRMISREAQIYEVVDTFNSVTPSSQVYVITGVRGSGKTVTMTTISSALSKSKKWIVINLNPTRDLLVGLAANLYEHPLIKPAFIKADLNFSFVVGASISSDGPAEDVEVQLRKMFKIIKAAHLKVLIAIDEVTNNNNLKVFSSAFQIFMRENYPIFLLMTGLYENIKSLQNEKALTFLYRAPKIELKPLGIKAMSNNYREVFDIPEDEADDMAKFTCGYSYAFQVLGYLRFKYKMQLTELIPYFDEIMEEYAYEKIWSELSEKDKTVLLILAKNGKTKVARIQMEANLTSSSFSTYRRRLGKAGLINTAEYGYCSLTLPRFGDIIRAWE
ncbi:ATP-binding protein [Butyrivibrio sp. XPD2002]|uniref:ATP-binding protein n=1 Tax=Butyrivibrio sp. XPD2002 TaxID=1280665 RepID=UPI00041079C9|nr:ATP-binding protein [Butyrivibrio sp. XPD2002]